MTSATYEKYWATGEEAWQHIGETYERYFVPSIGLPWARRVIEAAALQPGERVLDVGSGTGVAARLAAERVGSDGTVAGVDPTPPMLAVARRTSPAIDWHRGTAEELPVADGSFDAVVCSLSFQFFGDRGRALHEMHRVLVPGGRVALSTPGPTPPLMSALDDALAAHIGREASMFVQRVFSVHEPDQIRSPLHRAGFTDIDVQSGSITLRLPPPTDFLWQYVLSTPLAAIVTELDGDTRAALERDVAVRCQQFVDGDTLVMEPGLLLATARRPR